jgi:catechol 2,3-dioxygenase-like lactoylglutathione lyase family enzyme
MSGSYNLAVINKNKIRADPRTLPSKNRRYFVMHSSSSSKLKLSFDTVFYYVTDMEASIAFYRDTLGLPMVSQASIARFDLDGVLIELVPLPPGTVVPGSGNARLCFSVANLQETLAQMHARGLATGKIREKRDGKLAFFHDPDGNELCLWEEARAEKPLGMEAALLHS